MPFKGSKAFPKGETTPRSRSCGKMNGFTSSISLPFETLPPTDRPEPAHRADRMVNSCSTSRRDRAGADGHHLQAENNPTFQGRGEPSARRSGSISPSRHDRGPVRSGQTISHDDLWRHYQTYYGPNNAIAVAVGDFDEPRLLERIEALFGALPARSAPPQVQRPEPPQRGERRVNLEGPGHLLPQIAYHAPRLRSRLFPMLVATSI
jgi:hypothetical protein